MRSSGGKTVSRTFARSVAAEFVGTLLLVLIGVGSAVAGIDVLGPVGVALAFGLVLLALAYAIGPVSGCHVNPAVTLGVLLARGITPAEAAAYWAAQFAGGISGALLLWLLTGGFGGVEDKTGTLGSNDYGTAISLGGAFLLETLLTLVLVGVVLLVTGRAAAPGFAGLAIGLVLTAVHLVGIPLTGTSVNPARSLGPALFAGGDPLAHVWLFLLAPLVGAVIAVAVARLLAAPSMAAEAAPVEVPATADTTGADLPSAAERIPPPARAPEEQERHRPRA
jgi:aquaporin Z